MFFSTGRTPATPPAAASPSTGLVRTGTANAEGLLKHLEWTVLRRLDGLLQVDYRTLLRGTGMDLADLREYQFHDDVRHIDWNVTARLQQPHVRVFTEDREMTAWFLLDLSPSMDFGSKEQRKRDVAARFVAMLARLLTGHGNRVGALLYGSGADTVLPARGGRQQVLQLMHTLQRHRPRPHLASSLAQQPTSGPTRLNELLQSAGNLVRRRSTVFVVSDFISEPGWEQALGQLSQRHEVTAVRLTDPLERELPDLGMLPIQDSETGEQIMVDTHDKGFRQRFARIATERDEQLAQTLARAGVDTLELSTDEDLVTELMRFTDLRKRRSRAYQGSSQRRTHTTAMPGRRAAA